MTTTTTTTAVPNAVPVDPAPAPSPDERAEALSGTIFGAALGAFELLCTYLGDRLGLYRAVHDSGPTTPEQLARRAGISPRYAREWLEQQAAAGILEVDADGRFLLPAGHDRVVLQTDAPESVVHLSWFVPAISSILPALQEAFRTGGGVPYAAYGDEAREAQATFNRWPFRNLLTQEWLPAIPDVHRRLQAGPARLADIACGYGWSSIALAQAYPDLRVDGIDSDAASIAAARRAADEAGVADRVRFELHDATAPALHGPYDVVTILEALHDMGDPVGALTAARDLVADDGAVIVMDERVGDALAAPAEPMERFFHAASVVYCLPQGLADGPDAAGTVLRTAALRDLAARAGFDDVEVIDIDHPQFRFYRLR